MPKQPRLVSSAFREKYHFSHTYMLFAEWEVRMVKNCDRAQGGATVHG